MGEQSNIIDIIKSKLIQASTATTSAEGRESIRKEVGKLLEQMDNIAIQTTYNGVQLLQDGAVKDGVAKATDLSFQVGDQSANVILVGKDIQSNSKGLGLDALRDLAANGLTDTEAKDNLAILDTALTKLNSWRADYGSTQNQLESANRNLLTQVTNIKAAESIIRDVDYAEETANFNRFNIISQAGSFAMSQSNSIQQNILRLLQ